MRSRLKSVIERVIIGTGVAAVRRRAMRGRTLIVAYHNVVPDGERVRGDLSLHLPQRRFAEQLELLGEIGHVVPLSRIGEEPIGDRPRFVITFDDAYAGALSAAVAELRSRKMPATVFAAPSLFGQTPWWDVLADGDTGLTPDADRDHAVFRLAGRSDAVLEWARSKRGRMPGLIDAPKVGTVDQLKAALEYEGLTVGSHSWSHANLAVLRGGELEDELRRPAVWLENACADRYVPWLAYPYGLATPETERAAAAAGYAGALRVEGGWLQRSHAQTPYALPRLNIPRGLSEAGFTLRVSGVVPVGSSAA